MGKDFAEADAEAMALFDKANAVLGFDLKKTCFEGPAEELTKSNVCQPAIFVTSFAAYTALRKKRPSISTVRRDCRSANGGPCAPQGSLISIRR